MTWNTAQWRNRSKIYDIQQSFLGGGKSKLGVINAYITSPSSTSTFSHNCDKYYQESQGYFVGKGSYTYTVTYYYYDFDVKSVFPEDYTKLKKEDFVLIQDAEFIDSSSSKGVTMYTSILTDAYGNLYLGIKDFASSSTAIIKSYSNGIYKYACNDSMGPSNYGKTFLTKCALIVPIGIHEKRYI